MRNFLFVLLVAVAGAQVIPVNQGNGGATAAVVGQIQTATGGTINQGTLTFTLSQAAVAVGTGTLVTQPAACYTSTQGNIVGLPDPQAGPVVSTNTASGTLSSGTYYIKLFYVNSGGYVSAVSPESTAVLTATAGTINVNAPLLQPAGASGYGVAIGTTPGGETIQATVTGWTQYHQSIALVAGSALPTVNNSVCNLYFSDQLIPTGTYYTVNLVNRNGSQVSGFPQTWCTYGGASGTINVSQGAPSGNCNTTGVFYPTPIFSAPQNGAAQSISGSLGVGGALTSSSLSTGNINSVAYLDGVVNTTLAAALATLPTGGTVHVPAGTWPVSAQIVLGSNIDIECDPNGNSILKATDSFSSASGLLIANGAQHVRIHGCVIDGDRGNNANQFPLLTLTGVTQADISANQFRNGQSRMIAIAGSSNVILRDNEIYNFGQSLPASIGNEGIAIAPGCAGCSSAGNIGIQADSNRIHDGVIGIAVYGANPATTSPSIDIDIAHNHLWAMSSSGILFYNTNATGSVISGRVIDNHVRCTGWQGNTGTWDTANCPPGLLQTGSTSTPDGVGFELNSPLMDRWIVTGNESLYNWREGFDNTAQLIARVNTQNAGTGGCAGNCATWQSGDQFLVGWKTGTPFYINGTQFSISSVQSATVLTLTTAPGTLTNVGVQGTGLGRTILTNNTSCYNGNGNPNNAGHGFADLSSYSSYTNNLSCFNRANGFIDTSVEVTHTGDRAFANNRGNISAAGFAALGLNSSYINVGSDDDIIQQQGVSVSVSATATNTYVNSGALCRYTDCTANTVSDSGTNTRIVNGNITSLGSNIPIMAALVTTAAASDNVTVTGMTASGHCQVTPTNAAAATSYTTTFVSAKTTNQITVSHAVTANMNYDISCTPN